MCSAASLSGLGQRLKTAGSIGESETHVGTGWYLTGSGRVEVFSWNDWPGDWPDWPSHGSDYPA